MKPRIVAPAVVAGLAVLMPAASAAASARGPAQEVAATTATPIKHFIFLMQGGRTFDNYFGTYPGADGIPAKECQPRVLKRPRKACVRPFSLDGQQPPPLGASSTTIDNQYNHGKMDGFVAAYDRQERNGKLAMGYYDRRELPFYWNVAKRYVLFDHFFSSVRYGIRANRSYWVSAAPAPGMGAVPAGGYGRQPTIFDRLQAAGVSWKFYVQDYRHGETYKVASASNSEGQTARVPLLNYRRFARNPTLKRHIVGLHQYYADLAHGTLPAVSYIASSAGDNERSAGSIAAGQGLVRNLVTQLMESRYWDSSALLVSYDGSGGWFDHVRPPRIDGTALGFRVPALLISAYAGKGQVAHTVLDYTSALKFIEQNWGVAPLTSRDRHADSLISTFNFAAAPRLPSLIPAGGTQSGGFPAVHPPPPPVRLIYLLYGTAAGVGLLLLLAAGWPVVSRRLQAANTRRAAGTREADS